MTIIKEIEIKNYPDDNTPVIRVFNDGTSYLLIDEWPLEDDDRFTESEVNNFEKILSDLLGVLVEQEDRDRFLISTNDLEVLEKLEYYLKNK